MASSESPNPRPAWRIPAGRRVIIAGAAVVVLAAGGTAAALATGGTTAAGSHSLNSHATKAKLAASTPVCTGPAGAAYIATAGYQAFDAISTSDCYYIQQYNVADPAVPNTGTEDFNYSSTDEGEAISGDTLYFADTGNDTVSVINAADLDPSGDGYEDPPQTIIPVGINPESLAVTPDGGQVWVADTGPQTGGPSLGGIDVISTSTDKVTGTLPLQTDPRNIAFSPNGDTAYVTTGEGLYVINTATLRVETVIRGLGDPEGVTASPDGSTVYVTNTVQSVVDVISAATNQVTRTIAVGQMPWQMALTSSGGTLYVADGDSNAISVISTASDTVTSTITDNDSPVSLALTPDGSELWVGGLGQGLVTIYDTSNNSLVGTFNVGYYGYGQEKNQGDGEEPTAIVITSTPAVGSK
jgi:YVTN family beta-propeller protein